MRKHTQRQLLMWMAWLEMQWSRPDRTAYYLMQVSAEVRRGNAKKPAAVKMEHFKLNFGSTTSTTKKPVTPERVRQVSEWAKASWIGVVGKPVEKVVDNSSYNGE